MLFAIALTMEPMPSIAKATVAILILGLLGLVSVKRKNLKCYHIIQGAQAK
jgi:hypothetical protein